ncbi:cord and cs domain containing protein [Zymoseptoria brevis]|uniref:Cord and cs domain containing protein n=1 Tax=Zymoseptoria brevis TaxID=1047168 RepID=A0A0F4GUX9_9PEZI|nr:cord and cs domain containing protein [Zymoseptoria brevis]
MAQKCVHKGCEKLFSDPEDACVYHPGPPVFHEGQKGWKCCKPRVLTFDEFMTISPCTTGKHTTVDDTPAEEPKPNNEEVEAKIKAQQEKKDTLPPPVARAPVAASTPQPAASPAPPEEEDDDPSLSIRDNASCKRKGCGVQYKSGQNRDEEECVHHPGQAIFHEGSKGWTCCKRRVLEFDEFMKIQGCKSKSRHLFVGKKRDADAEELVNEVRNDFYQTATTVIASLYLKMIDKERSKVEFSEDGKAVELDLVTSDKKRYQTTMLLFGPIDSKESKFKIMGTKLELTLAKASTAGWPVLRATDPHTGEIIQAGRAGRV